ncbi:MAG TPA: phasin family protein [Casimicrobiaceae bacterium]|nr:phasin family protein [Casimicrobiaceae bacterium]
MTKTATFTEINKAGYDTAIKLATLSLDKIERLAKLNLKAAKSAFAETVENAGSIAGLKDVNALLALNAELTEAGVQNALGYTRSVYGIASDAQSELSALAEETFAAYTKGVTAFSNAAGFARMVQPFTKAA